MKLNFKFNHRQLWLNSMIGMTWGFLATLVIGTIIGLLAIKQNNQFSKLIINLKNILIYLTPFAIGGGIALKAKFPPLIVLAMILGTGIAAQSLFIPSFINGHILWTPTIDFNLLNGPGDVFGAWIIGMIFSYFFQIFTWKNVLDMLILPLIGILIGLIGAFTIIYLTSTITVLLQMIIFYTVNKYHWLAILLAPIIGVLMGLALSLPTSSAAIAFAVNLHGDAATATIAGTSAQMLSFGVMTYWATGNIKKALAVSLGSSMLQMHNFMRYPKLLIIPTICSGLTALIATASIPLDFGSPSVTSGMGTSALYGQIFTLEENGWTNYLAWLNVIILQLILPIFLALPMILLAAKKGFMSKKELQLNYH